MWVREFARRRAMPCWPIVSTRGGEGWPSAFTAPGIPRGPFSGSLIALSVVWTGQGQASMLSGTVFRNLVILSVIPAVLGVVCLAVLAREASAPVASYAPPRFQLSPLDRRFRLFLGIMIVFTLGNSSDAFLVLRAQQAGLPVLGVLGMVLLVQRGL